MRAHRLIVTAVLVGAVAVIGTSTAAAAAAADGPRQFAAADDVTSFEVLDDQVFAVSDTAGDGVFKLWQYAEDGTGGAVTGSPTGDSTVTPFGHELLLPGMLSTYDPATSTFHPWTGISGITGPGTAFVADGVITFESGLTAGGSGGWTSTDGINFTPAPDAISQEAVVGSGATTYAIELDMNTNASVVVADDGTTRTPIPGSPTDAEDLALLGNQLFIAPAIGTLLHYTPGDPAPAAVPGVPAAIDHLAPLGDAVVVDDGTNSYLVHPDLSVTTQPIGATAPREVNAPATLGGIVYMTGSDGTTRGLWSYASGAFHQVLPATGTVDGAFSVVKASSDAVYFLAGTTNPGSLQIYVYRPGTVSGGATGATASSTSASDPAATLAATGVTPGPVLGVSLLLLLVGCALAVRDRRARRD